MLSIACCFVRNGGNFSHRDSRVKDFFREAGEDSYACFACFAYLLEIRSSLSAECGASLEKPERTSGHEEAEACAFHCTRGGLPGM